MDLQFEFEVKLVVLYFMGSASSANAALTALPAMIAEYTFQDPIQSKDLRGLIE